MARLLEAADASVKERRRVLSGAYVGGVEEVSAAANMALTVLLLLDVALSATADATARRSLASSSE